MDSFKCSATALLKFYEEDRLITDVIDDIEKELSAENKVVCQFNIDGRPITMGNEGELRNMTLSQINHIEYYIADLTTLVIEVAQGWISAIEEQAEPIYLLAQEMVEKPSSQSYKKLEYVFTWCSEFVESLGSMKIHRPPNPQNPSRGLAWDQLEGRLSVTVRELLVKSEKKDFKGVSYVLEYDLVEIFLGWKKELEKFIAEVRGARVKDRADSNSKATSHFVVSPPGRSRAIN